MKKINKSHILKTGVELTVPKMDASDTVVQKKINDIKAKQEATAQKISIGKEELNRVIQL